MAALAIAMAGSLAAQVEVTVVRTDGSSQQITLASSGGIFVGQDYMVVSTDDASGPTYNFDLDDVKRMMFAGNTSGIAPMSEAQPLSLRPTLVKSGFTVEGIGEEPQPLKIYAVSGSLVAEQSCRNGDRIHVESLPQGMYLVRVGTRFGRIVKQ